MEGAVRGEARAVKPADVLSYGALALFVSAGLLWIAQFIGRTVRRIRGDE